jgi:lysophospholipase L1-like esterase
MKPLRRTFQTALAAAVLACLLAPAAALSEPQTAAPPAVKPAPPATRRPAQPKEAADVGAVKGNPDDPNNGFLKRHEGFLKDLKAKNGKVGVLFVGDSITDGWRGRGKQTFEKNYGPMDPLNIGIGGDRTQHVIWRLEHGEVEGISPKAAVLMIGTNNLGSNTNEEIVAGVTKIVQILHEKLPQTRVLLLAIFPRGASANDPNRARIKAINEQLAKLDDGGKTVKYLDIGPKFLAPDGSLPKDIMPDALHPNEKGYEIWAEAMGPTLEQMMKS